MKGISQIAEFLWKLRMHLRFGELSRAPLQLLRFEMAFESATCECYGLVQHEFRRLLGRGQSR